MRQPISQTDKQRLKSELEFAGDSPTRLAAVFSCVKARLGHEAASQLWWGAFGAQDAAET